MNLAGKECIPGEKHFMSRDELAKIANDAFLINESCGDRDPYSFFNLSKHMIVDEYTTNEIIKINFLEFLEAFANIAERSS